MDDVIKTIQEIISSHKKSGLFQKRRANQITYWIKEEVRNHIQYKVEIGIGDDSQLEDMISNVLSGEDTMYNAIDGILKKLLK